MNPRDTLWFWFLYSLTFGPQRLGTRLGLVTGIVGAAGGLGGFFLPSLLGAGKDATGTYGSGIAILTAAFFAGAIVLVQLGSVWAARWPADAVSRGRLFCYRRLTRQVFSSM